MKSYAKIMELSNIQFCLHFQSLLSAVPWFIKKIHLNKTAEIM